VNGLPVRGNVWSVTAGVLVAAAVTALVVLLTNPYTHAGSNIPNTLMAAVLGGTAFFAGLALAERGALVLGLVVALVSLGSLAVLLFAIWADDVTEDVLAAGLLALAPMLAFATRLLATVPVTRWLAGAAGVLVAVAAAVSLEATLSDAQFWRVGTTITSLWIVASLLTVSVPLLDRALTRSRMWFVPCALLAGIAVAGLVALNRGEFAPQGYNIVYTLAPAVGAASALVGGLLALERGALLLGWTALAVAPPALGLVAYGIWADTPDQFLQIWAGVVITAALLVALMARLFARGKGLTRLAAAAGVLAGAAALVGIWDVWTENVEINLFPQASAALWVVAVLCCLLVPVLEQYRSHEAAEAGA
jgi:hypothetical protein